MQCSASVIIKPWASYPGCACNSCVATSRNTLFVLKPPEPQNRIPQKPRTPKPKITLMRHTPQSSKICQCQRPPATQDGLQRQRHSWCRVRRGGGCFCLEYIGSRKFESLARLGLSQGLIPRGAKYVAVQDVLHRQPPPTIMWGLKGMLCGYARALQVYLARMTLV